MAVYKVPQDVEAEDKLLGPFSFKQFIFLFIAVAGIGVAYVLSRIILPLAVLPLPVILFFGILALPLRKDQPMEVYLAAIISFILKPKLRLWQPDGIERLIEVIAPPADDRQYGKGYSQEEVQRRLSYLASIVDTRGWAVRGGASEPVTSMRDDLYNEAQATYDPLDEHGTRSQQIDTLLAKTNEQRRQHIIDNMRAPEPIPEPAPAPIRPAQPLTNTYSSFPQNGAAAPAISSGYTPMSIVAPTAPDEDIKLVVNPYPNMNQSVIQPLSQTPPAPQPVATPVPAPAPAPPSKEAVSPAIIDLANNHDDLSVETLAREAERIRKRELVESEEVVISLR